MEMAGDFAESEEIRQFLQGEWEESPVQMYEKLYAALSGREMRARCYLVDTAGKLMLRTNRYTPEYVEADRIGYNGMIRRMRDDPGQVSVERYLSVANNTPSVCIGRAIEIDGAVEGYFLCDIPEDILQELLRGESSFACAITDRFGNLLAKTVNDPLISHGKLVKFLRDGTGKITVDGRTMRVAQKPVLDGSVVVYTIADVGYMDAMFVWMGILLLALVALIAVLLLFVSQRFARRKSKVLDDMVTAIQNIKSGDLSTRLEVTSQDEFRLFAEEYNNTLAELQKIMKINEEVTRQTVITEIKQLESQFNPHFLYNTLNTIKYMVDMAPDSAQEMITDLSEILRYSIKVTSSQTLLKEDLEYTRHYLAILQYRFGDMLRCSLEISPETLDCMVPKLIVQPIIENAIKYGFRSRASLEIHISAELRGGELVLTIRNNGTGMQPERLAEVRGQLESEDYMGREHIGLYNIHRRIQLLYGRDYGLSIESSPDEGTEVTIRVPEERGKRDV